MQNYHKPRFCHLPSGHHVGFETWSCCFGVWVPWVSRSMLSSCWNRIRPCVGDQQDVLCVLENSLVSASMARGPYRAMAVKDVRGENGDSTG